MRRTIARLLAALLLFGLAGCGRGDEEVIVRLQGAMSEVKASAEAVLAGKQPVTRAGLAELERRIGAAGQAIDGAQQAADALEDSPGLEAAALDYLKAVRGAVDQTRDRYTTAIALKEALAQDHMVSAAIGEAQDEAALERASADANAKAGAVAAAVSQAGNAVLERERRLEAVMKSLQQGAQTLAGYALISHEALDAAMASNVTADRSIPVRASTEENAAAGQ